MPVGTGCDLVCSFAQNLWCSAYAFGYCCLNALAMPAPQWPCVVHAWISTHPFGTSPNMSPLRYVSCSDSEVSSCFSAISSPPDGTCVQSICRCSFLGVRLGFSNGDGELDVVLLSAPLSAFPGSALMLALRCADMVDAGREMMRTTAAGKQLHVESRREQYDAGLWRTRKMVLLDSIGVREQVIARFACP